MILDGNQPADTADDGAILRASPAGASSRPWSGREPKQVIKVDADRDDVPVRFRADAHVEQLVAHPRRHGHERVGSRGQGTLGLDERPVLQRGEVALQDMAMERVNDGGNPGAEGGEATQPAGLRRDACAPPAGATAASSTRDHAGLGRPGQGAAPVVSQGIEVAGTPGPGSSVPSRGPDAPQTRRVSKPRARSSLVRNSAWRAGPPTLSRVMTRRTRGRERAGWRGRVGGAIGG